jgi:type IV pilus assembly protein PilB
MHIEEGQLVEFILDSGLVSRSDVEAAKKEAEKDGGNVGKTLVKEGKLTDDELRRMQAYVLGIPFVDLKTQKIDIGILSIIPEPIARNHNIIAFKKSGEEALEVAMLDTEDLSAIDFIKKKTHLKILPRLTDNESMKATLLQYQKSLKAEFGDIIQKEIDSLKVLSDKSGEITSEADLKKLAEDLPVVRIVDTLLKHAIIQNASDIHIEPQETELLVRYRIDGLLHDAMVLPKNAAASITARIKVLSNLKLDEKRLPQDGRFKIVSNNEKVSFRVSVLPTYYGEKTVMRLLRENVSGFTLEILGFHGKGLNDIHDATKLATGMILTTGPTGSGKTTTLYTVLDILNTPDVNISTIEDPIEYQMKRINQTQVKPEIGFTFASGIRTLVRQDPDIIMVGEIRDNETAALAINAALTGHLVLSTLHTNSAAGAIPRLMDMKCEPFLLVSTISVIIGQRLIRKLAGEREILFNRCGI